MPTYGNDILPDTSGRSLGAQDARWDAKLRNLDVSGMVTGNFAALAIFKLQPKVVPFSATPNFDGGDKSAGFKITLTGNVTAPAFNNFPAGQLISIVITQDAVGGRAFPWPGNVRGGMDVGKGPNEESAQLFWYDGVTLHAITTGVIS